MSYTFQWIDGDDGTDIVGETTNTYLWTADLNSPPNVKVTNILTGLTVTFYSPSITVIPGTELYLTAETTDPLTTEDDDNIIYE